jgi:hypothetical protein
MFFQKCLNCEPGNWQPIDPHQLRLELAGTYQKPDETIDMILIHQATAKTATATYRRGVPQEPVKDWARS